MQVLLLLLQSASGRARMQTQVSCLQVQCLCLRLLKRETMSSLLKKKKLLEYSQFTILSYFQVQQSEPFMHIHISTLFKILSPYMPLQSIESSSLCCTAGPYQLFILYIIVSICQSQSPNFPSPLPLSDFPVAQTVKHGKL